MATAVCLLLVADATQPQRYRVAFLGRISAEKDTSFASFVKACRRSQPSLFQRIDLVFVDTDEHPGNDPIQALRKLPASKLDVLLAPNGTIASLAARHAAGVPLVFSSYVDPVREGFVSSMLQRPEPITGIWISEQLDGKRLETLHDAYPSIRKVAVFTDRSWNESVNKLAPVEEVAKNLGLSISILVADSPAEAQSILDTPEAKNFDAWLVPRSYLAVQATPMILERLRAWRKPVILGNTSDVRAGAPMSYAVDTSFVWPALAELTARVIAGENPGDIPIQRPQRFVLAVRAGPDTGLPIPRIEVIRRADIVIR